MIRYTTWLSSGLSARKASDGSPSSPADAEWALSMPIEDFIYVSLMFNNVWTPIMSFRPIGSNAFRPVTMNPAASD